MELGPHGLTPMTVALDALEGARPWIEAAEPTHPSLIDEDHRTAELFHIVNVPTMLWVDEEGKICRPHDARFGTDHFVAMTGKPAAEYLDLVRSWVHEGAGTMSANDVQRLQPETSAEGELARCHRRLAKQLLDAGHGELADRHFERAGELAPLDWTIRRGSLPLRGRDPFAEFPALAAEGVPVYPIDRK